MKRTEIIILVLALSVYLAGCGKKETASLEPAQEPLSMESLSTLPAETKTTLEAKSQETMAQQPVSSSEPKLEALPPSGPYKPPANEIQAALKNAGYYTGQIDGKAGLKTKKAIEEFQKANGLKADGKVGPKTWALLSTHLNVVSETEARGRTGKKR